MTTNSNRTCWPAATSSGTDEGALYAARIAELFPDDIMEISFEPFNTRPNIDEVVELGASYAGSLRASTLTIWTDPGDANSRGEFVLGYRGSAGFSFSQSIIPQGASSKFYVSTVLELDVLPGGGSNAFGGLLNRNAANFGVNAVLGYSGGVAGTSWIATLNGIDLIGGTIVANTPARLELYRLDDGITYLAINGTVVDSDANAYLPATFNWCVTFSAHNGGTATERKTYTDCLCIAVPAMRATFP